MENFANPTPVQVTLREMHQLFSSPRFWTGLAAAVGMLTIMGPFNTLDDMEFAQRLVYWASITLLTAPIGFGFSIFFSILLENQRLPVLVARIIGGALAGIPVALAVWLLNVANYSSAPFSPDYLLRILGYTAPIAMGFSVIFHLISSAQQSQLEQMAQQASLQPALGGLDPVPSRQDIPLLQRLPVGLGRDLISLQAQDHYVRAVTTKGSEMLLMRLSDAEKEISGIPGFRVHRSWWVADDHLERIDRVDGKPFLVLDDGTRIPVSRTYLAQVRSHLQQRRNT